MQHRSKFIYHLLFLMFFGVYFSCSRKKEQITYPQSEVLSFSSSAASLFTEENGMVTSLDVDALMESCIPVYVNVNVHWFLDDECGNSYALKDLKKMRRSDAYKDAHRLVQRANDMWVNMADNKYYQSSKAPIPSEPVCIPLQFVLRDVYVHCDASAQKTRVSFSKFYKHEKDGDKYMNVFISNVNGASGFAGGRGHMMVLENTQPALFNHEMGHNLSLMHAYINERSNAQTKNGCMDVYLPPSIKWDGDGDGKIESNKPKGNCWNTKVGGDKNNNDVGDWCEGIYKDNPHPCCSWASQDNNLMMSSAWANSPTYAAITPCQVESMMHCLNDKKSKYIDRVGGCPPPSAIIGQIPKHKGDFADDSLCFHLEASFNVASYEYAIIDNEKIIHEVKSQVGQPEVLCLQGVEEEFWSKKLRFGRTYILRLLVKNSCGIEDERELEFTYGS